MRMPKRVLNVFAPVMALLIGSAFFDAPARAQDASWPNGPVTIIVPFPPAGSTDPVARFTAEKLSQLFGHPVIVSNQPGGKQAIGTKAVVDANPDGRTLLVTTSGITIDALFGKGKLPYEMERDLVPVTKITDSPYILAVSTDFPAQNLHEFIEYARANPGAISYATAGVGASNHMIGEYFEVREGVDMVAIPYQGAAAAMSDLYSNSVQATFNLETNVRTGIAEGRLRALGIMATKRSPTLPDVPTFMESGLEGYDDQSIWYGMFAPAGTPPELVERIYQAVEEAARSSDTEEKLHNIGMRIITSSPDVFAGEVESSIEQWRTVIEAQNLTVDW